MSRDAPGHLAQTVFRERLGDGSSQADSHIEAAARKINSVIKHVVREEEPGQPSHSRVSSAASSFYSEWPYG
jgi:hypothetical protein